MNQNSKLNNLLAFYIGGKEVFGYFFQQWKAFVLDRKKRHALSRAAVRFLKRKNNPNQIFRFDVVEVVGDQDAGALEVRHIVEAFHLDASYGEI